MIDVQGISKRFGSVQAVDAVSFQARDGEITGLLGHNGAGKSTTLRILSTVIAADSGTATIDGHDCKRAALEVRQRLGVLPHGSGLYPNLTARENIAYFARLRGLADDAIEDPLRALIEQLDMRDFIDRRAKGFSQGQKLKTALARALIHRPQNILLDEPTSGLDVTSVRSLRELLRRLKSMGCCVLFSSHVMQEVSALCDDIVIIAHGRVVADGAPDAIREAMQTDDLEEAFMRAVEDAPGAAPTPALPRSAREGAAPTPTLPRSAGEGEE
ncbi:MAG TPA: ATP-binding cassette domain-containing protein [Steroidobacteraceae bacterium]|nr:ATP-binding cassette domain-containing protein [Steroidobacteraceae bacterium]